MNLRPLDLNWKCIFRTKAVYNLTTTIILAAFNNELAQFLGETPSNPAYTMAFLALAFVFGIGYWWVSIDITQNHPIVALGILGQLSVFMITTAYVITGVMHPVQLIAGIIDLIFAILFSLFLWKNA